MPAMRKQLILLGLVVLLSAAALVAGDKSSKSKRPNASSSAAPMQMDDDKRIVHALNRFTFGVRPGDVERVHVVGLDKWFDEQLHPEKIDDGAVESRLAPFRTLKMSTREMVENFPPPQVLKAIENGRMSMPHDPAKKAVYESRMAAYQQRQQNKEDKAAAVNNAAADADTSTAKAQPAVAAQSIGDSKDASQEMSAGNEPALTLEQRKQQKSREDAMYADLDTDRLLKLPPDDRYKAILKMPVEERLDLAKTYKGPRAMQLVDDMKPEQRETVEAMIQPQAVLGELAEAKLLRAIYSNRQLDEVMTDFWFNHFNVFIGKGPDRYMVSAYERDVIRPHALGKFKDILAATAKSPAMLFYLDNWQSVGPNSELALYGPQRFAGRRGRFQRPRPQAKNRPSGLNENYAREIMELHTLGVDGGYTQKDVTELAKILTGWTIDQPQRGGDFVFNQRLHEPRNKTLLGHTFKEDAQKEGERAIELLAKNPSTAN